MAAIREWLIRLRAASVRRRTDADLEAELRAHLELAAEDARRRGQTPDVAARAARLRAGGVTQAMDALRDQRGLPALDAALAGVASLPALVRRHSGYFAFATVTIAAAVGLNLIVFTIVNALWLRPLPFPDADRLVHLMPRFLGTGSLDSPLVSETMPHPFVALAGQIQGDETRLYGIVPRLAINGQNLEVLGVTPEYFGLFGLPVRGRDFTSDDNQQGGEPVAIISDRLWSREFGRRGDVIGAIVAADPVPVRVIGVAPPGFEGARRGERADVWIPSRLAPRVGSGSGGGLMMFARLAPGVSPAEATAILVQKHEAWEGLTILPLKDVYGTPTSRTIPVSEGGNVGVVAGLALLVLAGGCATLAALVLVHYERRRRELAVRLALGASRRRLAGELSRELLILALAGTLGALVVANWGLRSIPSLSLPGGVNLARLDLSIDWRLLGAAIATTLLTLMAAASLPIARFTRSTLASDLLAGPSAMASAASQRLRQALLALHVAATIVVLVSAGLLVRTVVYGLGGGAGFDIERTAFVSVDVSAPDDFAFIRSPSDWDTFDRDGLARLRAERRARIRDAIASVPGVLHVAAGTSPIGHEPASTLLQPLTAEVEGLRRELLLGRMAGSAELPDALGLPLLAGRALTPADATVVPAPAVVTMSLAQTLWPGENPLGKVVRFPGSRIGQHEVAGVTSDFVFGSFARPATGVMMAVSGDPGPAMYTHFIVRAAHPGALLEPLRQAIGEAMPARGWLKVATGREIVAADLARQRLGAWFFSGFGLTALLLGVGGVFGLVAYLAESRRREFAVRLALGATHGDLVRKGLAAALVPVALGAAAGLVLAGWASRLFASLLSGLSMMDPLTYALVALTMVTCASLAGLTAAWRLRRMAPADALRAE